MNWNFDGSRHGKSSADGEAGVVKSSLGRLPKDDRILIDSASDVFNVLNASPLSKPTGNSRRHFLFCGC